MPAPTLNPILDHASLSPRLTRRIRRLARRTRLRRREQAVVAEMLSTEARERLAAGESEQTILASLRPLARTARRLRRGVLRDAPLRRISWGALTWIKRSIATSLVVTLITYPYLFWRFHAPEPKLTRNLGAEYNATVDGIPPEDRAADLYRQAREAFEPIDESTDGALASGWPFMRPGEEFWDEACDYIDRNERAIGLIRAAASKPSAGYRLSTVPPIESAAAELDPEGHWGGNPFWVALCMEPLGEYRNYARILAADARLAAQRALPDRAHDDLLAILGLARHAEEGRSVIGDLVGIAIRVVAFELLAEIVVQSPDLLDEPQLARLQAAIGATMPPTAPKVDLEIERLQQFDYAQRVFTDNGNGDGRICYSGIRFIRAMADENGPAVGAFFLGPISAVRFATRKQFLDEMDLLCAAIEQDSQGPLWQWPDTPGAAFVRQREALTDRPVLINLPLILAPALGKAATAHEHCMQSRDAALVIVAIARYRLLHGRYPDTLDSLLPDFLARIPPDRYDGAPIKYRLTDAGFPVLYSVGADRRDDGGFPRDGDEDGVEAMKWVSPSEARLLPPGDWIILPRPRPEPYTDED